MRVTAGRSILDQLAAQRRRVFADWRALVLLRSATFRLSNESRRWINLPSHVEEIRPLLAQMKGRGEIEPVTGLRSIYKVTVPYAQSNSIDEYEVAGEINPYASLSHSSALAFHGLTDQFFQNMVLTVPSAITRDLMPTDTDADDWQDIDLPTGMKPKSILGREAKWVRARNERFFGYAVYRPLGYAVKVMTIERTLLDGLLQPELCGGIAVVLGAWARARDTLDLDTLVEYVDRFGIAVLRQRVGFVCDELGLPHQTVEQWRGHGVRGGSSRLVATAPYATTYSEDWNLSLNAPVAILRGGEE